jgi:putative spermidine/putrescine transport system permease protein
MATYTLTHVEKKPLSFSIPVIAAAGAFAGLFVGTAQGSGLMGVVGGAILLAVLGFIALGVLGKDMEKPFRWALVALMAAGGYFIGGLPGLVVGTFFGWFFGFFIYWIGQGRYRANLVPYLTGGQVLWHYTFRMICGLIFFFLITPIVVVMPLSFNAEDFFTFTPEMLRFDPEGYSLKHYRDFFTSTTGSRRCATRC